ncbi:LPXTG cell wall anchor domain-containing protein [Dellaglioa algida]|uniref:LPXTG cell wall anchor domain-containing protein n=1 Tax=Dellaglioa algida TaxID=105612 RepID=UPI0024C47F60|nr:LPXTG cell wall anchor domain-containing protein [Dellaglioa algida]MDK1728370.1 LPXTG cell wall anchor domain-containing protein [Dellaglioa algida]MDK1736027.1 LPXTG cell wall anchor domain-containing protein [Dellaglioa algida]MDK1737732.1 LPXTG cell wall anchor domain-containing protein [Dellaglioa algida]
MKKRVLFIVILFLGFITLSISRPVNATVMEAGSTNITVKFKENKSVEKPTNVPDRKHNDDTPANKGIGTSVVGGILPQTNEEKSITAFLVGLIILLGTLLLFYIRRDKKEENNN